MNPKHIDEVPAHRRAIAPYNFVELPDTVVAAEDLPSGDRYHLERNTGRIECTLTTKSQLYTRCGWSPDDFAKYSEPPTHTTQQEKDRWEKEEKAKWEKERREILAHFFSYPGSSIAAIPGSSIRGMLRTLVEIVSFSKMDRVTDNKLFYRSLGDPALKRIYQANFVDNLGDVQHSPHRKAKCYRSKVHAGFLFKRGNSYVIKQCGYGRINFDLNNPPTTSVISNLSHHQLYQIKKKVKTPNWQYQQKIIYVDIDPSEQDEFFGRQMNKNGGQRHPDLYLRFRKVHSASFTPARELQKGTLVITGDMQHKHLEFVFLDENLKEYPVTEEMVRRFQDDDQITKWQKDAYPKDKPSNGCRQQNGYIRDGEPVFFLLNNDGETVRFFGRAQMFRLPYEHSPLDFVPPKLRDASRTDIAEAIFGYVNGKKPREQTCAGRVFISDGTLKPNQEEKVKPSLDKTPESILLYSPKPTTFQHYLVQQDVTQDNLKHYANKPPTDTEAGETVIRGHKLYWHKPCKIEVPADSDTQTSLVKPIDPEIDFTFKVYFENLSNVELGALLWVLYRADKPEYCLSLGMGKPLGMGAVKVNLDELWLGNRGNRTSRYSSLFSNNNQWELGETDNTDSQRQDCIKDFEQYILSHIDNIDRADATILDDVRRIKMLLEMLRCDRTSETNQHEYMKLNDFKNRKVLPTPLPPQPKKKVEPPKKKPPQTQLKSGETNNLAMTRPKRPKS
ncbi:MULTISPECIES: TIGR03986 family type III CRISPR-associated RAMP protein [unclassified Microcoleus]|uniref:TIGR03986 family type III CRISPR-associated RAMP protein n=1 Tax=unclassified Microcoleus TaxID=2642155 RepID=UPI002FD36E35